MDEYTPSRFLELPAELRESIYGFSFSTQRADDFKTPAISRTSRLLRKEALPLFYKTQRFALNLVTEDSIDTIKTWLLSLSSKGASNDNLQPLLLIRQWALLLRIDCDAVLGGQSFDHPWQALRFIGVNVDLNDQYQGGRVQEIRSPAIYDWVCSAHKMFYSSHFQKPLRQKEIAQSDANALGFRGVLKNIAEEIEPLWGKRRNGMLEAQDYAGLLQCLRPYLTIHPAIVKRRRLNSRELGRHIIELDRLNCIASEFMDAI